MPKNLPFRNPGRSRSTPSFSLVLTFFETVTHRWGDTLRVSFLILISFGSIAATTLAVAHGIGSLAGALGVGIAGLAMFSAW